MRVQLKGVEQAVANLAALPRKVAHKHLRIAMNAAGGRIAKAASALAQRDTGLLAKSIGTKVKIPDASWDVKHHGKPAYIVIGPRRRQGRFLRVGKQRRRGHGAAQASLRKRRKAMELRTDLTGLQREREAVRNVKQKFKGQARYRNPSRYAHLVEKGHAKGRGRSAASAYPFLAPAARIAAPQAMKAMADKLAKAFETEAAALPK